MAASGCSKNKVVDAGVPSNYPITIRSIVVPKDGSRTSPWASYYYVQRRGMPDVEKSDLASYDEEEAYQQRRVPQKGFSARSGKTSRRPLRSCLTDSLGMAKPVSGCDKMVRGVDIVLSAVCVYPGP